jgi:hypothetical protein
MSILNLEPICAEWGRAMIEAPTAGNSLNDQENTITKALGVLAENGLYAMGIFLLSRKNSAYGMRILTKHLAGLWRQCDLLAIEDEPFDKAAALTNIQAIAEDLPKLILAKKLAEQAMIFARYHAKAEIAQPPATRPASSEDRS